MKMTKHLPARRTLVAGLVGLVVGLCIAGGAWWYLDHNSAAQAATPTTISRTVAATVDTIKKSISTTGTLTPAVQQDVSFVASGNVTAVNVTAGQQVTAGQPLATVDTLTMQQTLASANLTLAKAQATLVSDQTALSTAQDAQTTAADAGDDTSAADAKVATDQQQITVDQTSITTAQAAVDAAQTALNSATLLAPIDGIVSTVNVTVGQKITGSGASSSSASGSTSGTTGSSGSTGTGATGTAKAGSTTSGGSTGTGSSSTSSAAFVIVSTNSWKVDVTVDDAQIGLISVGDQAQLAVTSSTDPLFGTISSIGLISTASGDTASYPVEVTVTGTPTGLHDGTSATVTLIYAQFSNVLTVPSAAVHTVNGQSVVYTMSGDQQVSTPVVVGESDGTSTEITSGLNEGDEVVVTITTGAGGTGRTGTTTGRGTGGTGTGGFGGFGGGGTGGFGGTGGTGGTGGFGGGAAPGGAGAAPGAAPVGG